MVAAPWTKSSLWSKSSRNVRVWHKSFCMLFRSWKSIRRGSSEKFFWKFLRDYGFNGQFLRDIKSFYCRPEVCVRVNGKQSKPFHVGIGLRQGCVLSLFLFIVYINWIDKRSQADECATIVRSVVCYLLMIWFCFFPQNLDSSTQ